MFRWAVEILIMKSRAQWQQKTQKKSYAQLPIHYCNGTMEDMAAIYDPKRCSKKVVLYNWWLHSVNNNLFYICVRLTVSRMATHFTYFYLNLKGLKSWKWAHTSFLHLSDNRNFGSNFHRNVVLSSRDHAIQTLDPMIITSNSMIVMLWLIDFLQFTIISSLIR